METLSLNGTWTIDWLSDLPYTGTEEPVIHASSDAATTCPVPGYSG